MPSHPGKAPVRPLLGAALLAVVLWAACASPTEPGRNAERVSALMGTAGGTLVSKDGLLQLTVPAGALAQTEEITITPLDTARLGPEFDGVPVTLAFELGPSGMQFATPVSISFVLPGRAVVTDTGITLQPGSVLTSANGAVEALDSLEVEIRGDTVVFIGQLSHFSPLVVSFCNCSATATVAGVPDQMMVRTEFTVAVRVDFRVFPGWPKEIEDVGFEDGSTDGIAPISIPTNVRRDLPGVTPTAFQDSYTYTCTREGVGHFTVYFHVSWRYADYAALPLYFDHAIAHKPVACVPPQLTVTRSGSSNGTVTSNFGLIDCGIVCKRPYPHGSVVQLTATATSLSKFVKWSGDCSGTNPVTTVLMDKDRTCDAEFRNLLAFNLTVNKSGTGVGTVTSSPAFFPCGIDCLFRNHQYPEFTSVTLTATPFSGNTFGGWSGDCNAAGEVIMDAAKTCTARFDRPPVITSIQPNTYTAGGPDVALTVNGNYFDQARSIILMSTTTQTATMVTTWVSAEQLTATVPAAQVATAGTRQITVETLGVGTSAPATLTVKNPPPTITTISPTSAEVGDATFTMTVTGSGFVPTSVVLWNEAVHLRTSYVNATMLTAEVPAYLLGFAQDVIITVVNPTPGGGTSALLHFEVVNGVPTIALINPASAAAGGPAFALAVLGTKFLLEGTVVRFNGVDVPTTRNSSTTLTANIPASAIATAGSVPVTVRNPAPGGGTSAPATFTITAGVDICNVQTPLAYGGASAAGTLTTGDCNLGFGAFPDYAEFFSVTTTQQASTVNLTANPGGHVRVKDGDVYTDYIFSSGSAGSRNVFLPTGSYVAQVATGSGVTSDVTYSLAIGPAANEDIGNCSQTYARPGIGLTTQTLAMTDCSNFGAYGGSGTQRVDRLNLSLKVGESITIVQTSSTYQPIVALQYSGPSGSVTYVGVSSCDPVMPTLCSSTLTYTAVDTSVVFVSATSAGAGNGAFLGAYTLTIIKNP